MAFILMRSRLIPLFALVFAIPLAVADEDAPKNIAKNPVGQAAAFHIAEKEGNTFASLSEALVAAQDDDVVVVSQDGPFPIANIDIKKRVTIKSSAGCKPVFAYARPIDRFKLEVDYAANPEAATMFHVNENATFEGIHFQMDVPRLEKAAWTMFANNSSRLRLLNCKVSTMGAVDFPAIRVAKDGVILARNCAISGFSTCIEIDSSERTDAMLYSCLVVGRQVIAAKGIGAVNAFLIETSINAAGVFDLSGLKGAGNMVVENCIVKAKDIVADLGKGERTYSGQANLYNFGTWVRKGSDDAKAIAELSEWKRYWQTSEKFSDVVYAIFAPQFNPTGPFKHDVTNDSWKPNPDEFDGSIAQLADEPVGANIEAIGPGMPFEHFTSSEDYSEWFKIQLPSDRPRIELSSSDGAKDDEETDRSKKQVAAKANPGKTTSSAPRLILLGPTDNLDFEPPNSYRINTYVTTLRGRLGRHGNDIGALFRFVDTDPSARDSVASRTVSQIKAGRFTGHLDTSNAFEILQQSRLSRLEAGRWLKMATNGYANPDNVVALQDFRPETDRIIRRLQTHDMLRSYALQVISRAIVVNELRRLTNKDVQSKIYHASMFGFLNLLPDEMEETKSRSDKVAAYISQHAGTDPKIAVKVADRVYGEIDRISRTRWKLDGVDEWWWKYSYRTLDAREAVAEQVADEAAQSEELSNYVSTQVFGSE